LALIFKPSNHETSKGVVSKQQNQLN